MAHEIYTNATGRASIAYLGKTPWHGLGQSMNAGASMDDWRRACGFDWRILKAPVEYRDELGFSQTMAGRQVLYRSDTGAALSVMSDGYREVQPAQVLDFFADVCQSQAWTMETAGVLKGGAQYWALAKAGPGAYVNAADRHEMYMLLATSADGSLATLAQATDIRVVCKNTLRMSLRTAKGKAVKVYHSKTFDSRQVKADLGMVDFESSWQSFTRTMQRLGEVQVTRDEATAFFSNLLRPEKDRPAERANLAAKDFSGLLAAPVGGGYTRAATDKDSRAIRGLAEIESSYYTAPGACPGTAYGLLQGVTHYLDHARGKDTDKRLSSAWFGQGAAMKETAFAQLLAMSN